MNDIDYYMIYIDSLADFTFDSDFIFETYNYETFYINLKVNLTNNNKRAYFLINNLDDYNLKEHLNYLIVYVNYKYVRYEIFDCLFYDEIFKS